MLYREKKRQKANRVEYDTHTHTQPFYSSVDFVRDNLGEPVPEETFNKPKVEYEKRRNNLVNCSYVGYVFVLPKLIVDLNATCCQQSSATNVDLLLCLKYYY